MALPEILQRIHPNQQEQTQFQPQPQQTALNQLLQQRPIYNQQSQNCSAINNNNFEQTKSLVSLLKNANNPVGLLRLVAQKSNNPLAKLAIDLGTKFNGNFDQATAALIKEYNLDEEAVRQQLQQLGVF